VFFASYLLVSRGVPLLPVLAGCVVAAFVYLVEGFARPRRAAGPLGIPMHDSIPLPLAMLIIFGSAKLLAELFERLGQPRNCWRDSCRAPLVGPSLLGWIQPNEMCEKRCPTLGSCSSSFWRLALEVKASEFVEGWRAKAHFSSNSRCNRPVFWRGGGILFVMGSNRQIEAVFCRGGHGWPPAA